MKGLLQEYSGKKKEIRERLGHFRSVWRRPENKVFEELAFCLFTPQTSATAGDRAVKLLVEKNLLFNGSTREIAREIPFVRFRNNKAKYLVLARKQFTENGKISLKKKLSGIGIEKNHVEVRGWLNKNVKGLGLKEAGHFLRNIGFYENIAILDRHILKNMVLYGAIKELPKTLTEKRYLEIEKRLLEFCKKTGIPAEELDLLFWSRETGRIFK